MWEGAFGQQDVERNIATRLDTPFQLDGTTQAFVGVARDALRVGRLVVARRSVSKFAPTSPDAAATLRQLLTHTTAGPEGLTFSYRPERLAPVAAAIAGCTDSSFRWGVGAFARPDGDGRFVPGADVAQAQGAGRKLSPHPPCSATPTSLRRLATPYAVDSAAARRLRRTSRPR